MSDRGFDVDEDDEDLYAIVTADSVMDWIEKQIPPPSWHDEGDLLRGLNDDVCCPLTSVVRRCYLNHLEQTLLQNYNSCRTHTIQRTTLQDLILQWEQNALRSCMMTTMYQKAMRQLINAIKADTKLKKLTPVLTATIKKSQRQHLVDVSTQTESALPELTNPKGFDSKHHIKRENGVTRESSDGPFLTPPSEYPLPTQTAKKSRRHLPFPPQNNRNNATNCEDIPLPCQMQLPFQYTVPPPRCKLVPEQVYSNDWPIEQQIADYSVQHENYSVQQEKADYGVQNETFQPISVITNACTDFPYDEHQVPEPGEAGKFNPTAVDVNMENLFRDGPSDELRLGPSDSGEPDYNWDQIEEEMARLYGQAFTEDDGKAMSDEPEPETAVKPVSTPKDQNDVDLDLVGALHEAQLQSRLEHIRKHWTLERQAKLKRKFVELFGREDGDDLVGKISAKKTAKCKQRIAPWIVKHLMPLYKQKRIASRHLFKSLAKHISDLLVQRTLYPDECDVWMGVQEFFSGGTTIDCEADFSG